MMKSLMVVTQLRQILVMFMLIWKVSEFTITCPRNYPCWCYRRDISNITFSNSAFCRWVSQSIKRYQRENLIPFVLSPVFAN